MRIRRALRKTFIILLSLSAVGTGYLWAESYAVRRRVWFGAVGEGPYGGLLAMAGRFQFHVYFDPDRSVLRFLPVRASTRLIGPPVRWYGFWFENQRRPTAGMGVSGYAVGGFPIGVAFGVFAVYPSLAFVRGPLRRYCRRRKGLCIACGYNLTGLTENRCPECATEFELT